MSLKAKHTHNPLVRCRVNPHDILRQPGITTAAFIRRDVSINAQQHLQLLLNTFHYVPDMGFAAQFGEQDFINHDRLLDAASGSPS